MTKIKFCGMRNPQDVITASALGVDYVGFILTQGFRRSIGLGTFCELAGYLDDHRSGAKKVGVFVDEPIENILEYYAQELDIIQLHGSEDERCSTALRAKTGKPIIKAFRITCEDDIRAAERSSADFILLDSGTGTGRTFDHSLIKNIQRPFFLAGGLTADNVSEAIQSLHPYAVDASSSLETDGFKDKNKMAAFAAAVRKER